jgi:hypothetical protein
MPHIAKYRIRPAQKRLITPQEILEALEKRGWKVEFDLEGHASAWESARLFKPGPPEEIECFLLFDPPSFSYTVSLPAMPAHGGPELQFQTLDSLRAILGGTVEDASNTRVLEEKDLQAWASRFHHPILRHLKDNPKEAVWMLFAWAVTLIGVTVSLFGPEEKRLVALLVTAPAFLSALGLTFAGHRD